MYNLFIRLLFDNEPIIWHMRYCAVVFPSLPRITHTDQQTRWTQQLWARCQSCRSRRVTGSLPWRFPVHLTGLLKSGSARTQASSHTKWTWTHLSPELLITTRHIYVHTSLSINAWSPQQAPCQIFLPASPLRTLAHQSTESKLGVLLHPCCSRGYIKDLFVLHQNCQGFIEIRARCHSIL